MNYSPILCDNHIQNQNEKLDALVRQIKLRIFSTGVCQLRQAELAAIWASDENLPDAEKRVALQNFSLHYQFRVMIAQGLSYAIFR